MGPRIERHRALSIPICSRIDSNLEARIDQSMAGDNDLLREIRDLLLLIAEPALAKRDERLREALIKIVGKSKKKADAVALMDGTRSQSAIQKICGIDVGELSRLTKALREANLLGANDKDPKLVMPLPLNIFDAVVKGK